MSAVLFKSGVQLHRADGSPLRPAGVRILGALAEYAVVHDVTLTVTCGTEAHKTGKHPKGEALDVRTKDLSSRIVRHLHHWLTGHLGPEFTVLYEVPKAPAADDPTTPIAVVNKHATAPHLHIQLRKDIDTWPV
jgi:hypothetical protein